MAFIPATFLTENLLRIGFFVALAYLSIAMSDRDRILAQAYSAQLEGEAEERTADLQEALDNVRTLEGLMPICASCRKIRDDTGFWNKLETYITTHSGASFSHSICPDCAAELYPEHDQAKEKSE